MANFSGFADAMKSAVKSGMKTTKEGLEFVNQKIAEVDSNGLLIGRNRGKTVLSILQSTAYRVDEEQCANDDVAQIAAGGSGLVKYFVQEAVISDSDLSSRCHNGRQGGAGQVGGAGGGASGYPSGVVSSGGKSIQVLSNIDTDNVFILPKLPYLTLETFASHFPVKGWFHFRFKQQDDLHDFVWVDLAGSDDFVPCYQNIIVCKALRLPPGSRGMYCPGGTGSGVKMNLGGGGGGTVRPTPNKKPTHQPPSSGEPIDLMGSNNSQTPQQNQQSNNGFANFPAGNDSFAPAGNASFACDNDFSDFQGVSQHPQAPTVKAEDLDRQKLIDERERLKNERIAQVNANHQALQERLAAEKTDRAEAGLALREEMDNWAKNPQTGNWRDIRTLLGTLDKVLWDDSNWTPMNLGDLMSDPTKVKKAHRKAILISHPDKHNGADGKRAYRAERIFEAINESFKTFKG